MRWELGRDCCVIHLTLVPYLAAAGELKTKPTQHSVKTLQESGVQPDIIVCRTDRKLTNGLKDKIALFCNVDSSSVIESLDAKTIYEVPLLMRDENLDTEVLRKTRMPMDTSPDLKKWEEFLFKLNNPSDEVNIGLVGKYVELKDAYKSINEAIIHASAMNECKVNVRLVHSEYINKKNVEEKLKDLHAILVAPGFGERGIEGKIESIRYARENMVPFFGICLGMQCAVIEFGRSILGYKSAHSTEMNPDTKYPVIDLMEEQKKIKGLGGTMRLGKYPCTIDKNSKVYSIYQARNVSERHRHRYEFNNEYIEEYENNGMLCIGINPNENLVEIIELKDHPWFIGVQFHPEYQSTVAKPHPLFVSFVEAAMEYKNALVAVSETG
jgi:CTP synthase